MSETIRIFIGCAPNHEDAESQAVLEYTLRKYASQPLEINWMKHSRDPNSPYYGWDCSRWPTPFSGFRWALPELCDHKGKAIWMDSDMIVMADIAELWNMEFDGHHHVIAKGPGRLCVSLWDCERAHPDVTLDWLRSDPQQHREMAGRQRGEGVQYFPAKENWNCLDGENYQDLRDPCIKCLHYTSMPHQPQVKHALKRLAKTGGKHWFDGKPTPHWRKDIQELFDDLLIEAEENGFKVNDYCQDPIYGDYKKGSVAALRGKIPTWGRGGVR